MAFKVLMVDWWHLEKKKNKNLKENKEDFSYLTHTKLLDKKKQKINNFDD